MHCGGTRPNVLAWRALKEQDTQRSLKRRHPNMLGLRVRLIEPEHSQAFAKHLVARCTVPPMSHARPPASDKPSASAGIHQRRWLTTARG